MSFESAKTLSSVNKVSNLNMSGVIVCECGQPKRAIKSKKKTRVKTKFGGYISTSKIVTSHMCLDCPRKLLTDPDSQSSSLPSKGRGELKQSKISKYFRK